MGDWCWLARQTEGLVPGINGITFTDPDRQTPATEEKPKWIQLPLGHHPGGLTQFLCLVVISHAKWIKTLTLTIFTHGREWTLLLRHISGAVLKQHGKGKLGFFIPQVSNPTTLQSETELQNHVCLHFQGKVKEMKTSFLPEFSFLVPLSFSF